jgi:outer membrane protein insertion porin family
MRERRNRITRSLTRVTRWPLACVALAFVIGIHSPSLAQVQAPIHHPRVLRFSGVPMTEASLIRNKFPFVFEREVSLSEIDEIVRWLMSTGHYSNIEVVERDTSSGTRELVLLANVLRHIQNITIDGNHLFAKSEVSQILNISEGQIFERKELLAAADELRNSYERAGYHNARVEIDFKLPNDTQVEIHVTVNEGTPLRVSDLTVETVNDDLTQRLKRYARRLKGRTLNSTSLIDFEKSVSEYLQQNRYLIAKISSPSITYSSDRTEAKISYSVDSPWRYEFFFNGNNFLSEGSLIDRFDLDKFSGSISSPAPDLAEKIRRVYQSSGFTNVEVTYREKTLETLYKRQITFDIKEGARVRIRKIAINGTISRPEEYYASFMKASSSDLIGEGYYNRKDIDDGAKRLIKELQNQGYLRARVQSQRADFSKDKTNVTIHLQIDEGPLTQIREIRFDGATAFARVELLNSLKIKTGAALGLQELEDSIQQLKEFYRDAGYLEMKITNENERDRIVTYNDTNTQATVTFQIIEGPKVIVQGIALEGNSFTKEN